MISYQLSKKTPTSHSHSTDNIQRAKSTTHTATTTAEEGVNPLCVIHTTTCKPSMEPKVCTQMPAPVRSFDEMDLDEDLLRGIYAYGFENPSTVQASAILPMLTKRDTITQAQSGTGKTATFSIAMLQSVDKSQYKTQAIVLAPTRHLAEQSATVCAEFAAPFMKEIEVQLLIGGRRLNECITSLKRGPQIVSGTPGRVAHMIRDGHLRMEHVKIFCLDEADQMLDEGFQEQVYEIFRYLPDDCQIILVSATMPPSVLKLSEKFMRNPFRILLQEQDVMLEGITQFQVCLDHEEHKFDVLQDIYATLTIGASIIFVNTRRQAENLHIMMANNGFAISKIHGEMPQMEREMALADFRSGSSRVLISTDVLAKGIDVQGVSVVVNYDLPREEAFYIHRIGRAGRFGRRGVAISLVTARDFSILRSIEQKYECVIEDMPANIQNNVAAFSNGI